MLLPSRTYQIAAGGPANLVPIDEAISSEMWFSAQHANLYQGCVYTGAEGDPLLVLDWADLSLFRRSLGEY